MLTGYLQSEKDLNPADSAQKADLLLRVKVEDIYPLGSRNAPVSAGHALGTTATGAMLTQQGLLLGKTPKAGQLFLRNCERLQAVLDACPELRSLGAFWRELRQERGDRLDDLLALTTLLGTHLADWRDKFKNGTSFA